MSGIPRCSIVIRAYNEQEHIGRLLSGIEQQTGVEVDTILVDSGSTDRTVDISRGFAVRIIEIDPLEFTFGRSLNLGCSEAKNEFIVLASAHVYPVYPDWLERLLEPFQHPQVALTYGRQRGNGSSKFSEHQIFAKLFPAQSSLHQAHPFCNNANAAIRRDLWKHRKYDEDLPGLEDLEWAAWAIDEGHELAYVAKAEVIHVHNETPRQVYNRYRREAIGLKRIRPQERFHLVDFIRLYISNATTDFRQAARSKVLRANYRGILWFRWMQLWGTYRGFSHSGPLSSELKRSFYYPRRLASESSTPPRDVNPIEYGEAMGEPPEA